MWKTTSSNPMPRSSLSFALFASPVEVLHRHQRRATCAYKAHIGIRSSVPTSVPKRGPITIIRQPTPTKFLIKNGPEIDYFRPVL